MRRRKLVVLLLMVLVVLGAIAGFVVADPRFTARYHLRRAAPGELKLTSDAASVLTGHALAFAQSPVAKDLLPELVALAREEAAQDTEVCFRPLLVEVAVGSTPRRGPQDGMTLATGEVMRAARGELLDVSTLGALVACLRSRDRALARWVLARLPADSRALEAVLERGERSTRRELIERKEEWQDAFAWLDGWRLTTRYTDSISAGPMLDRVIRSLRESLEKNRSKLPEQVK